MKLTKLILCLLLPLCFCACNEHPCRRSLQTADSLTNTHPDSAVVLLQQLTNAITSAPEEMQIYYKLLCVKAQDKAYITHTSDSLIAQVLQYYRSKRDKKHLLEACYYAGRVYSDLGDAPQALEYFHRAVKASEKSTDYQLINRIYSQMGTLYLYQDVYDKAPEMFRKAYHYSTLAKDSADMAYDLRDIGRCFSTQEAMDSAVYYYKEADKLAERIDNKELRNDINGELSYCYIKQGEYKKAYEKMLFVKGRIKKENTPSENTILARYYEHINQLDSASHYFSLLLNIDSYLYKQEAYRGLGYIARQKQELTKALYYLDYYLLYTDSLQNIAQTEDVRKTSALYNYQLRQKENRKLRIEANRQKRLIFTLAISLAFAIISFFAYRQYRQRKEQNKQMQQDKLKRIQEEQYKSSLAHIEQNKEQIKLLEVALLQAEGAKDQLRQDALKAQKELIERTNEQIAAKQKVQQQSEQTLAHADIYKKFYCAAESEIKIKEIDWQELTLLLNETYNHFTQRLCELYPVKEIELQVCLLIKLGMSPTQISAITIRSKQAVTSIRKRLYTKAFNQEGTPEQWDNFIHQF